MYICQQKPSAGPSDRSAASLRSFHSAQLPHSFDESIGGMKAQNQLIQFSQDPAIEASVSASNPIKNNETAESIIDRLSLELTNNVSICERNIALTQSHVRSENELSFGCTDEDSGSSREDTNPPPPLSPPPRRESGIKPLYRIRSQTPGAEVSRGRYNPSLITLSADGKIVGEQDLQKVGSTGRIEIDRSQLVSNDERMPNEEDEDDEDALLVSELTRETHLLSVQQSFPDMTKRNFSSKFDAGDADLMDDFYSNESLHLLRNNNIALHGFSSRMRPPPPPPSSRGQPGLVPTLYGRLLGIDNELDRDFGVHHPDRFQSNIMDLRSSEFDRMLSAGQPDDEDDCDEGDEYEEDDGEEDANSEIQTSHAIYRRVFDEGEFFGSPTSPPFEQNSSKDIDSSAVVGCKHLTNSTSPSLSSALSRAATDEGQSVTAVSLCEAVNQHIIDDPNSTNIFYQKASDLPVTSSLISGISLNNLTSASTSASSMSLGITSRPLIAPYAEGFNQVSSLANVVTASAGINPLIQANIDPSDGITAILAPQMTSMSGNSNDPESSARLRLLGASAAAAAVQAAALAAVAESQQQHTSQSLKSPFFYMPSVSAYSSNIQRQQHSSMLASPQLGQINSLHSHLAHASIPILPNTYAPAPISIHTPIMRFREPREAPLRKMSVNLIKTYKHINEVSLSAILSKDFVH
ncbi:unnamed protein product [Protopolystoma xenopodis]|uniref:Uncharacterized protein n=1 Tax=Protopolystoma xenopodis TaxID=117903 RepID=A0A3S5FBQ6_9PLAT|nr:unnamed protein product [Protopolystoma xenopodis]